MILLLLRLCHHRLRRVERLLLLLILRLLVLHLLLLGHRGSKHLAVHRGLERLLLLLWLWLLWKSSAARASDGAHRRAGCQGATGSTESAHRRAVRQRRSRSRLRGLRWMHTHTVNTRSLEPGAECIPSVRTAGMGAPDTVLRRSGVATAPSREHFCSSGL